MTRDELVASAKRAQVDWMLSTDSRALPKMMADWHLSLAAPEQPPARKVGRVTESIYNGSIVIPLADVQHIERHNPLGLIIVTRHTRWDPEIGTWGNNAWLDKSEADQFLTAWCRYRSELEADTLADLEPIPQPALPVVAAAVAGEG